LSQLNKKLLRVLRLPEVGQIGIVVKSIDETVRYLYETFTIGPWFRPREKREEHLLRGVDRINPELDMVMAFSGKVQYELIQHQGGDRTVHCDYLDKYGEGIHHLGFYVSNIDERLNILQEMGIGILQSGYIKTVGRAGESHTSYAYLDTAGIGGIIFELIDTKFLGMSIKMSRFWFELGNVTGDIEKIRI
jgi:methylmalonyl-CoA/ethylmalonyl-CoA epimerase